MKIKVTSLLGALTLVSSTTQLTLEPNKVNIEELGNIETGKYYVLTPEIASSIHINLDALISKLQMDQNHSVVFKITDDELDFSIYENATYAEARMDGVIY